MAENKIEILVTAQDAQMGRAFGRMGDRMRKLGTQAGDLGRSLAVPAAALIGLAAVSLKSFASFEKQLVRAGAVSNATAEELKALETAARDMGRTTIFTATQSAEALAFLAMAGNDAQTSIEALPSVLQLAAAGSLELGQAADIVTNVMAGMQLSVEELGHANDVLVTAFTSANTNLQQLGQAFKFAGPVASAAGVGFEETAAALALMGNAGIQATMAGTSLRGAITRMLNPSKEAAGIMKDLGVQVLDTAGNLLPLTDIIRQFEETGLSAADAMTIFGLRAGPGMLALVSQGSDALVTLTKEMEDSGGTAKRISDAQLATFAGQMLLVKSAVESVSIELGKALAPAVTDFVDSVRPLIASMEDWIKQHPDLVRWIGLATVGMAALAAVLMVTSLVMPGIAVGVQGASFAFKALVLGTNLATAAQWRFNVAMIANPIGATAAIIIAAVAGIVAAFVIFRDKIPGIFEHVGQTIADWYNMLFMPIINLVIRGLNLLPGVAIQELGELADTFADAFENVGKSAEGFADNVAGQLKKIRESIVNIGPDFAGLGDDVSKAAEDAKEAIDGFTSTVEDAGTAVSTNLATVIKDEVVPSLREMHAQLIDNAAAGVEFEKTTGPLRDALALMADQGLGNYIIALDKGRLSMEDFMFTSESLRAALERKLTPSWFQLRQEIARTALETFETQKTLGTFGDAVSLLIDNQMADLVQQFIDGAVSATELMDAAEGLKNKFKELSMPAQRLIGATDELKREMVSAKLSAMGLENELGPLREAMTLLAEKGLGVYIRQLQEGMLTEQEFIAVAQDVRDAMVEIADVITERLVPGLTEAQSALVLDKLAALELDPVLGHLRDAMTVLAEEGLGSVIQKLADGTIGKYEFLQAAQDVRDVLLEENAALAEQEARLQALKTATTEMKDASRIRPSGITKTARETIIGFLGGIPPGLAKVLEEMLLSTTKRGHPIVALSEFQGGGVVGGPVGAPQLAVVHGGETITPAGRNKGAQQVLNITMQIMGNVYGIDDLDEHIRRTWRDTATRGGFDGLVAVS